MSENNPWATDPKTETSNSSNPWGETDSAPEPASPWGSTDSTTNTDSVNQAADTQASWLTEASKVDTTEPPFSLADPFAEKLIPFDNWVENGLDWLVGNFRDVFQAIRIPIDITLTSLEAFLQSLNPWVVVLFFTLFAWQMGGRRLAAMSAISLLVIGFLGAWSETMVTLALVFTSVIFSMLIGIPLGIWMGK